MHLPDSGAGGVVRTVAVGLHKGDNFGGHSGDIRYSDLAGGRGAGGIGSLGHGEHLYSAGSGSGVESYHYMAS